MAQGLGHGDNLAGIDGEVGGRDDLDAAAIGLAVKFLELARFDNRVFR